MHIAKIPSKYETALLINHTVSISLIKLSILFFYRRIFRGRGFTSAFDVVNWVLITFQIVYLVAYFIGSLALCGDHFWARFGSYGTSLEYCLNPIWFWTSSTIVNFAIDLAVLIEPIVMVSRYAPIV